MILNRLKNLTLLYIEDDSFIREKYLETFNILFKKTYEASNYNQAIDIFKKESPDLLIIDIQLNEGPNGFDIVEKIREEDQLVPIIFLSAYSEVDYIFKAINNSVNGYIIKPLSLPKLIDVLNKSTIVKKLEKTINISKCISYNFDTFELKVDDNIISLGKKENMLLQMFLENLNKTLTKEEIEYKIWDEVLTSESALKNLIRVLRKKIGKDRIQNTSGMGWRLIID